MQNQTTTFIAGNESRPVRQSLFETTVRWIENLIKSGKYAPGAKLPSEREMGETLGVSRTVLREALRAVESRGLISVCAGKGVYVSSPDFDSLVTPMQLLIGAGSVEVADLIQARHFLEPGIAHVAALKATEEDICKLEENLQDMIENLENGDRFIAADQLFHMNLALATRNPVLYVMARTVVESLVVLRSTVYESMGAPAKAVQRHRQIIDAMRLRSATQAYQAMEGHILDVEEYQHIQLMQKSLETMSASLER